MAKNKIASNHAISLDDASAAASGPPQSDPGKKHTIAPIPVVLSQHWYHHRCGIDFSEQTWTDPDKRVKMYMDMSRASYEAYGFGSPEPAPVYSIDCYGHRITSVAMGCRIEYYPDQAPGVIAMRTTPEELLALKRVELADNPVVKKAFEDTGHYERKYGKGCVSPWFVVASPLNGCVSTWCEDFIAAVYTDPEAAQHAMRIFLQMTRDMYAKMSHAIDPEHFPLPMSAASDGLGNCPALMFHPDLYRRALLPVDMEMRRRVDSFGIHHCGVIDKYLEVYAELSPNSLDIGGNSDYRLVRRIMPKVTVSLMINGPTVEEMAPGDVDGFIYDMIRDAGPLELISAIYVTDVSAAVRDDVIERILTAHERIYIA